MKRLLLAGLACILLTGAGWAAPPKGELKAGREYVQNGLVQVKVGLGDARNEVQVLLYDPRFEEYSPAWKLVDHGSGRVYEKLSSARIEGVTTARKDDSVSVEWKVVRKTEGGPDVEVKYRATLQPGKYFALFEPVDRAADVNSLFYIYFGTADQLCVDGKTVLPADRRRPDGTVDYNLRFDRSIALYSQQNKFANIFVWMGEKAGYSVSFQQTRGDQRPYMFYSNPSFPSNQPFCLISLPVDTSDTGDDERARSFVQKAVAENTP